MRNHTGFSSCARAADVTLPMSPFAADPQALRDAVQAALAQPGLEEAVGEMHRRVQSETAARRPVCDVSGRCCRFEQYGHRLFVTTIELAVFARRLAEGERPLPVKSPGSLPVLATGNSQLATPAYDGTGCPFQFGKLCGVHDIRPSGCRLFFCDPASTEWQNDLYERLHGEMKRLHEQAGVPYLYVEWRDALRALGLAGETKDAVLPEPAAPPVTPLRVLLTPAPRPD